ncbi:MAG TPA: hypothetical protein VLG38_03805 [Gammaproteobacteria bacterium]|nr:hypothetical protein [Gammaproteobacteria bacterium]
MSTPEKSLLLSSQGKNAGTHQLTVNPNQTQRYIVVYPQNASLPHLKQAPHLITRKLNDTINISFVDLTSPQAQDLKNALVKVNGSIHINTERKIKDPLTDEFDPTDVTIKQINASKYPSAAPTCPKITMGEQFIVFFPDSLVNLKNFPGCNLSIGNNYSGSDKPCNPHSSYTYSVFKQVLGDVKLQAVNIPVFNCGGHGTTENITQALLDILDYAKSNPTKKVAMFFAVSGGIPNPAETATVQELLKAGVMVGVSAGNNGANICNKNIPPWNVPGVLQIGATMAPGDRCPYFTNWSDVVPTSPFGDCVNAYLPGQFTIKQFNKPEKGTSFAVPQAVAWTLRWWNDNPNATAADVVQAFKNHTVTITKSGPAYYPPLVKDGLIPVLETATFCSTNVTSNKPRPS